MLSILLLGIKVRYLHIIKKDMTIIQFHHHHFFNCNQAI
jgi:hypothetical protein